MEILGVHDESSSRNTGKTILDWSFYTAIANSPPKRLFSAASKSQERGEFPEIRNPEQNADNLISIETGPDRLHHRCIEMQSGAEITKVLEKNGDTIIITVIN